MLSNIDLLLAFGLPGGPEWIVLLVLGLLIFGRRLPEVGRSLGRGIVEFKRGIKGIEDEIEDESDRPALPREEVGAEKAPDQVAVGAKHTPENSGA